MDVGVVLPLGLGHEFAGVDPTVAWRRCVAMAGDAERRGFGSLWIYDHVHAGDEPAEVVTFEPFAALAALVPETTRLRLGHIVLAAGLRNPALVTKAICSLDAMSGGRLEFGLGAGWKRDEWTGYGMRFPPLRERQEQLRDALEIATRMMAPGRSTYAGPHASVDDLVNVPKPVQRPRVPIVVGGNGPEVTWRIAARYADELNVESLTPEEVAAALPVIAERCREIGRDTATLRISVHLAHRVAGSPGRERAERLAAYRALGLDRVIAQVPGWHTDDAALRTLADDARAAGAMLFPEATMPGPGRYDVNDGPTTA
jgi:alkanesulfonate monooxygenase SsuD/methylene tetrahydromethanopterin reductase-like flavin-dependent oxidoreductase (luciferase family)